MVSELFVCGNVTPAHNSIHTMHDDGDRIKGSAKSGTKVSVCVARLPQCYPYELYQTL
jgi:hypothetical protein